MRRPAAIPLRASGVSLPVFSLPSRYDQGDFGPGAIRWLNWLKAAKQRYWLILPLGPVDSTGSPYAADSAFALNPLLISPELLLQQRLLPPSSLRRLSGPLSRSTAARRRTALLRIAWRHWSATASPPSRREFALFCRHEAEWLEPYAQFGALKRRYRYQPWWRWPKSARRYPNRIIDGRLRAEMEFIQFCQWQAAVQWETIRRAAHQRGITIIGDLPFSLRHDSADVWINPRLFSMRGTAITGVAGMPPDQFSRAGQRWGSPVYNWPAHRRQNFAWWAARLQKQLVRTPVLRLDHFQGFIREWVIPARRRDGRIGHWVPAPGLALWSSTRIRRLRIRGIAEDLGLPLPAADALRRQLKFPGIRLFPFSWSGWPRNIHALGAITPDMVFMTSNHDLPSVREWWTSVAKSYERRHLKPWLKGESPWRAAIRLVQNSPAQLAIIQAADVFGLGRQARINIPGNRRGSWRWTLPGQFLTDRVARELAAMTVASRRTGVDAKRAQRYTKN